MLSQSVVDDADVAELMRRRPDAEVVEVAKAGHWCRATRPSSWPRSSPTSSAPPDVEFGFSAEDELFRDEVRTWLAEHLVGEFAALGAGSGMGEGAELDVRKAWERELADGRLGRPRLAEGVRRARRLADPAADLQRGVRQGRRARAASGSSARSCSGRR